MLVLALKEMEFVNLRHLRTGELIRVCFVERRHRAARIGFEASLEWEIVRDEIDDRRIPSIQSSECDVESLGRRHDPLGVAEAYEEERP